METGDPLEDAIEVLQQLGLQEYEARCFVGLSRLSTGTAKQLSELTEVPRTRVYDAIRVLEAQGLVEVQHASPQQFRAVPLEEATETLRNEYEARIERVNDALATVETVFSVLKRRFGTSVRARSWFGQFREMLRRCVVYNVDRALNGENPTPSGV